MFENTPMVWVWVFLALAGIMLAAATAFFLHRASRARQELSRRLHQAALGLDQRCDLLGRQIHVLDQRQRIDHLFDLIGQGQSESRLSSEVAQRLRRFALDLRAENLARRY